MIVQPVLIRIPFRPGLTGPQRVERQRNFARIALDHCARLSGAPAGPWPQTPARVPIPRDGFHWSITHKPRFAAAVIAREPVGIDIESLTPRTRDLSSAVASPEEWALIGKVQSSKFKVQKQNQGPEGRTPTMSSPSWRTFFEVWTAKEAVLKANSLGIGALNQCRIIGNDTRGRMQLSFAGQSWNVQFLPYAGHLAALACADQLLQWHIMEPAASERPAL